MDMTKDETRKLLTAAPTLEWAAGCAAWYIGHAMATLPAPFEATQGEVGMEVEGPTGGAVAVGRGAAGMAAADLTDMDTTAGNGGEGGRSGGPAKKKKKSKKRSGRKARMTFTQRRDERG